MKRKIFNNSILFSAMAALLILAGCEKESNNEPRLELEFVTVKSGNVLNQAKAMDGELMFSSGSIMFDEVEFEAEQGDDLLEIEFERDGDVELDFATGNTNPDISNITIPAGTYEEVEVELGLKDDGAMPSIVMEGVYTDLEGTEHQVRFEHNSDETFEVELEGSIVFEADASFIAQVTIDPASWFNGTNDQDFTSATKNMDGVIVISSSSNTSIYDMVVSALEMAGEVEYDYDDDDDDDDDQV